jgi:hypothetical protein
VICPSGSALSRTPWTGASACCQLPSRPQDQAERAASLLAAAGALLEAKGSGWLHAYVPRAPHDDAARAALRARTAGAAFDRAWERGRTLDTAGVVRYALEEASDARREAG